MTSQDAIEAPDLDWGREHDRRALGAQTIRVLRKHPTLVLGIAILGGMLLAAFFMPLPYDPIEPNLSSVLLPPGDGHLLGTDRSGFDVFSRTIAAAQRDIPLAVMGTLASLLVGVPLGLMASAKGRFAEAMMRGLDIFQSFPLMVLAVSIVMLAGNSIGNLVFAIMFVSVPRFIRLVRGEALALRKARFIEAAHAVGASPVRILRKHLLPNVMGVTLAQASLTAAQAIGVIAAMNFLGVGVSMPNPSWGSMIQEGAAGVAVGQWWLAVAPGMAVFLAIASFNMIADGLHSIYARNGR